MGKKSTLLQHVLNVPLKQKVLAGTPVWTQGPCKSRNVCLERLSESFPAPDTGAPFLPTKTSSSDSSCKVSASRETHLLTPTCHPHIPPHAVSDVSASVLSPEYSRIPSSHLCLGCPHHFHAPVCPAQITHPQEVSSTPVCHPVLGPKESATYQGGSTIKTNQGTQQSAETARGFLTPGNGALSLLTCPSSTHCMLFCLTLGFKVTCQVRPCVGLDGDSWSLPLRSVQCEEEK